MDGAAPLEQTVVITRGDEYTVLFPQSVAGKGDLVEGAAAFAAHSHPGPPCWPQVIRLFPASVEL